jgi:hypothetical protein
MIDLKNDIYDDLLLKTILDTKYSNATKQKKE